jgi:hypothetical protein
VITSDKPTHDEQWISTSDEACHHSLHHVVPHIAMCAKHNFIIPHKMRHKGQTITGTNTNAMLERRRVFPFIVIFEHVSIEPSIRLGVLYRPLFLPRSVVQYEKSKDELVSV